MSNRADGDRRWMIGVCSSAHVDQRWGQLITAYFRRRLLVGTHRLFVFWSSFNQGGQFNFGPFLHRP
jgi:hypothetical protein